MKAFVGFMSSPCFLFGTRRINYFVKNGVFKKEVYDTGISVF